MRERERDRERRTASSALTSQANAAPQVSPQLEINTFTAAISVGPSIAPCISVVEKRRATRKANPPTPVAKQVLIIPRGALTLDPCVSSAICAEASYPAKENIAVRRPIQTTYDLSATPVSL